MAYEIRRHVIPLSDTTGELDANRPVPFRLTPCLQSLISPIGITGPLQMSMVAACRCLVQPQYSLHSILRAILRDEFIAWCKVGQFTFLISCTSLILCLLSLASYLAAALLQMEVYPFEFITITTP